MGGNVMFQFLFSISKSSKHSSLIHDFKLIIQHMFRKYYKRTFTEKVKVFSWMIINELFIVKVVFAKVIKH